ncbi:hypothetical protein ACQP00_49265 [Dactylosporangium sp. CS-047395]|uniref:hypothetical protein n=1 Tax=Dactylosporangium sp. CS-047395 TaxID=3239936 RepID=UPI003D92DF07
MTSRDEQRRKRRSDSFRRDEADEADNWLAGLRGSGRGEPDPFSAPPPDPYDAPPFDSFDGPGRSPEGRSFDAPGRMERSGTSERAFDRPGRSSSDAPGRPFDGPSRSSSDPAGRMERSGTSERAFDGPGRSSSDAPGRMERSGTSERAFDGPSRMERSGTSERAFDGPGRMERSGTSERAASFDRTTAIKRPSRSDARTGDPRTGDLREPRTGDTRGRRSREDSPSGVFGPGSLPPAPPPSRPANVDGWSTPDATGTPGRRRAQDDDSPSGVYGRTAPPARPPLDQQLPSSTTYGSPADSAYGTGATSPGIGSRSASGGYGDAPSTGTYGSTTASPRSAAGANGTYGSTGTAGGYGSTGAAGTYGGAGTAGANGTYGSSTGAAGGYGDTGADDSRGRRRARERDGDSYDHGPELTPIIKPLAELAAAPPTTDDPPPLVPIFPNMRPDSSPTSGAARRARRAAAEQPAAFAGDPASHTGEVNPRTGDIGTRGSRTGDLGTRTGDVGTRGSRTGDLGARTGDIGTRGSRTGDVGTRAGDRTGGFGAERTGDVAGGGRRRAADDPRTGDVTGGRRRAAADDPEVRRNGSGEGALYAGETTMFRPGDDTGVRRQRGANGTRANGSAGVYGAPPNSLDDDSPRNGTRGGRALEDDAPRIGSRGGRAIEDDAPRNGSRGGRAFEDDSPRNGSRGGRGFEDDGARGGRGRAYDDDGPRSGAPYAGETTMFRPGEDPRGGRRGRSAYEDDERGFEDTGRRSRAGFEAAAAPDTARRDDTGVRRRQEAMRGRYDEPPQQRRALDDDMPYEPYDEPSEVRRRSRGTGEFTSGGTKRRSSAPDRLDRPRTVIDPVRPSGPRPHRWVAMLSVIAVVVVLGACGVGTWFILKDEKNGPDSAKSSQTSAPKKRDISSRDVDPKPLSEAEVFPSNNIVAAPNEPPYVILTTRADKDCKVAATEELATLLAGAGCTEVVRATMKSPTEEYLITAGIFNVSSEQVAAKTFDGIKPIVDGQKGRFAGMSVGAGTGTDALVRAPTQLGWNYKGHFITYCVIARVDGNNFAQGDAYPNQITYDIVETYLDNGIIENRSIIQPEATPAASLPNTQPS